MLFRLFPGRGGSARLAGWVRRAGGEMHRCGDRVAGLGRRSARAGRKARSAGPHAAAAERPGGAGNIFAPCVISGSSTRKGALGGKIRAPCILNRPIAPGNGCMGRGCCHLDLEKHAFRADVARKRAFFAHSAKRGCMQCDSCQPGPWGGRRRKAALGSGAGGAWVQDAGDGIFLAAVRRLLRGWLCREGENEKETAYAASLR